MHNLNISVSWTPGPREECGNMNMADKNRQKIKEREVLKNRHSNKY